MTDADVLRVPLRQWRMENFKSVEKADISLRPLTVLVGANSSGKSTLLQSILLMVQSVQADAAEGVIGLNGPLVSLGSYDDVRNAASRAPFRLGGSLDLTARVVSAPDIISVVALAINLPGSSPGSDVHSLQAATALRAGTVMGMKSVVDWQLGFSKPREKDSGAAEVRNVHIRLQDDSDAGLRRFGMDIHRVPDQLERVAYISSAKYSNASMELDLPAYIGTVRRSRPRAPREQVGAAAFRGAFPAFLAVRRPVLAQAVEHWIFKARVDEREPFPVSPDSIVCIYRDSEEDVLSAIVAALDKSLDRCWADSEGAPDYPLLLIDETRFSSESATKSVRTVLHAYEEAMKKGLTEEDVDRRDEIIDSATSEIDSDEDDDLSHLDGMDIILTGEYTNTALWTREREIVERVVAAHEESGMRCTEPSSDAAYVSSASSSVADFLARSVYYLGPLREDPRSVYRRSLAPGSRALGVKGEFAAAVLIEQSDREVTSPRADPSSADSGTTLRAALEEWLCFFDVATEVDARESSLGPLLRIREREGGRWLHLTNVGVGVSQLLPVLMICLMAEPGSLVLLEQPELHLHPALQQKLGDFLLACAQSGRQVIVETHSEYLVSRLRRRIADSPSTDLVDHVGILFAEKREGFTRYRDVRPNEFGGIEEWPAGFFDQSASEAQEILRAAIKKRKVVADKKIEMSEGSGGS